MRIGVFDSGLGGLAIARAIMDRLPQYDYLYLGDTKRVPYGVRSQSTIHEFVGQALRFLFRSECQIVILACNTASAESLRKSQQEYLPHHYPKRRVLGVIIPTVEEAVSGLQSPRIGVLATASTVESDAYGREARRQCGAAAVVQRAAPLLVPMIENDGIRYIEPVLDEYLAAFQGLELDRLVLGCTHYCLLKEMVRARSGLPVVSQDEVIPEKLADYLVRHPEMEDMLGKNRERRYLVTDVTPTFEGFAERLAGAPVRLQKVELE
jgi:glutamate racemase